MKKRLLLVGLVAIVSLFTTTAALGQYDYPWYTSYMIQNLSGSAADVTVQYYDQNGAHVTAADKSLTIPPNGQTTVVQYTDDPNLDGVYSAVLQSSAPVAVIVNQQTAPGGKSYMDSTPPFASYSGFESGSTQVTLPEIMYNWYDYYTEFYVQNVSGSDADIGITYYPGMAGASGVTDSATIKPYTSKTFSQESQSSLGAPYGGQNRFLGSAVITSTQPIVAVVNEHNEKAQKLFTYNGFTTSGSTELVAPSILRGHFDWYTSMSIGNPSPSATANITITYTADNEYSKPVSKQGTTVVETFSIDPGKTLTRYDGTGANPEMDPANSDLTGFTQFFGTAVIESDIPVVGKVNQESDDGYAESYNLIDANGATKKVVVPLIQADFYNFYTSLTVKNLENASGTLTITYTSDDTYSLPTSTTFTETHSIDALGVFNSWEGGSSTTGDVHNSGKYTRFNGAAVITSDVNIVAIVNEEKHGSGLDYGYSFNVRNVSPD